MSCAPDQPHRVAIILDVDDDPFYLYVWAGARLADLVISLRDKGIPADPVRIDIDDNLQP